MKVPTPTLPSGTRDFGPETMIRRNHMCRIIQYVFQKYGFLPMETPAMEKLSTLMGKYGEDGEQLIFRVLDSGDFLQGAFGKEGMDYRSLRQSIAHKGLRYDLTVPLARYVAHHQHTITFPFKRFQMQPVWRADRPQKGRFREFYQCDADIVGGDSLFYESEMLAMIKEVFSRLGIDDFVIQLNHRLLFRAIAAKLAIPEKEQRLCLVLDKLEKIGWEKVEYLLEAEGISSEQCSQLKEIMQIFPEVDAQLSSFEKHLGSEEAGQKAIADLRAILGYMEKGGHDMDKITLIPTLARGIGYYTGAIFEVKIPEYSSLGSVSAGGRYDDLVTAFGRQPLPSIGLSFGLERIYEVLLAKNLFPEEDLVTTKLLLIPVTAAQEGAAMTCLAHVRKECISAELYPAGPKLKKILSYANKKNIPFVAIIGEDEAANSCMFKNMATGKQIICKFADVADSIRKAMNPKN